MASTTNSGQYFNVKFNGKPINDKAYNTLEHGTINSKNGWSEAFSVDFSAEISGSGTTTNIRKINPVRIKFNDDATVILLLDLMNKQAQVDLEIYKTRINNKDNKSELVIIRKFKGTGKITKAAMNVESGADSTNSVDYFECSLDNYSWSVDDDLTGAKVEMEDMTKKKS